MKLGIDVGGRHTHAVIISSHDRIVGAVFTETTKDILQGIKEVCRRVLDESLISPSDIQGIFIGTSHLAQALQQGRGLVDTALIRVTPSPSKMKPGIGWPSYLVDRIKLVRHLSGGFELNGRSREDVSTPINYETLAQQLDNNGIKAVAIVSTFSPLYQEQEIQLGKEIAKRLPDVSITLSHQIGSLGYLERENAALMNAMLSNVMDKAIDGLSVVFSELRFQCPYWLLQNDGSLLSAQKASAFPIFTIQSGIASCLRGASYLTGLSDCLVVDMGGHSTEIGVVHQGEPQEVRGNAEILGIRVSLRLPKAISLPFGGDSLISSLIGSRNDRLRMTNTLTDAFVSHYHGDSASMESEQVVKEVLQTLREHIDRCQPANHRLPVVLVGGGSTIIVDRIFYKYGEVVHPPSYQICNAVGACMAPVSAQMDKIFWLQNRKMDEALAEAKQEVMDEIIRSGGIAETIRFVQVEEIPFAYYQGEVIRFRLKAISQLQF